MRFGGVYRWAPDGTGEVLTLSGHWVPAKKGRAWQRALFVHLGQLWIKRNGGSVKVRGIWNRLGVLNGRVVAHDEVGWRLATSEERAAYLRALEAEVCVGAFWNWGSL